MIPMRPASFAKRWRRIHPTPARISDLAVVSADGFDGKAAEYFAKAIQLDPKLAAAHELMADFALANDDRDASRGGGR